MMTEEGIKRLALLAANDTNKHVYYKDGVYDGFIKGFNEAMNGIIRPPAIWVSIKDKKPDIEKRRGCNSVDVLCCWGVNMDNVALMAYCKRVVRGKAVYRFEWNGRIDPFGVEYWMYLPRHVNYTSWDK